MALRATEGFKETSSTYSAQKMLDSNPHIFLFEDLIVLYMTKIDMDEVSFISETTVTIRGSRRRTTVPKEIVEMLHMTDGDRLRWILFHDGRILLTKVKLLPLLDE